MAKFNFDKEYGIVLEGGGAKGAYQIGVWKALIECGVKIKGVSGVSVGALNGALICMGDYQRAEEIWENITFSKVMKVNDEKMKTVLEGNLLKLNLAKTALQGAKLVMEGGFDISPLKELIDREIDEKKIEESPIEFVLGTFSMSEMKELQLTADELKEQDLKDYLLASAYFPAFKNERLGGKKYMDGGIVNNVPIDLLLKKGYQDIIVIRIFGIGIEKKVKIPEQVQVIEIAPRVNLGNLMNFDSEKSKRNMKIGYYDGLRCLKDLKGKIYYIDTKEKTEDYYLHCFIQVHEAVQMALLEYFKLDYTKTAVNKRHFLEAVLPNIAAVLKLEKDWTYEALYLSLLELSAKNLRIQKYMVYTIETLTEAVKIKCTAEYFETVNKDLFIALIMKLFLLSS